MSSIKGNKVEYSDCQNEALQLIRLVTGESQNEQIERYHSDPVYNRVIKHVANLYFTINNIPEHPQVDFLRELERIRMDALLQQTDIPGLEKLE